MAASGIQRRKLEVLLDQVDHLPTIPGVAGRLLPVVLSDRPNRRDLQLAIEVDAALASRALRLALALGRPADELTSIDDVFDTVPLNVLASHLLSVEIASADALEHGRLLRLWRHILATAMASQVIASRLGTIAPHKALLAGLLHDIGQIALPVLMPRAYGQVLARVETTGRDPVEVERDLLGVDHAVLGRHLAQRWGFPKSLQNVIWLHHQAQVPNGGHPADAVVAQVVRLADLLVRQEGFSYHPSEQVRESPYEAAERLGLSGAHAEQIGRQVAAALELNARPAGFDDHPGLEALWPLVSAANARLGRLYQAGYLQCQQVDTITRRTDLLMRLNAHLASCRGAREVLQAVAETARQAMGLRTIVPYVVSRDGEYVEGVLSADDGQTEEHFLYETALEGLEPFPTESPVAAPPAPVRAERVEGWLFERLGERLGRGPFYTVPMTVENTKVGGLVFSPRNGSPDIDQQEASQLVALASMAGIALKRTQAEADLVALSEELAEVNRQLQATSQQRLEQRNVAALCEMAAGAAHEINNPLAVISGRAQQLAADEKHPARREALKTIIAQADRISGIITELRLFAKPPAPAAEMVNPATLAQAVTAQFVPLLKDTPVCLRCETAADLPPIHVDPKQVASALKEVVQNAVEACSGGGEVVLTVQHVPAEGVVRFVVSDDGPGMPPPVRARAFDPFYSGYESGRHRGLGLPKAYRAIEANGGQMALESTLGQGTTVRITFPVAEPPAQAAPATG